MARLRCVSEVYASNIVSVEEMNTSSESLDVVILAAGKGTRMKSELPKVLHRLCGITLIERTLRAAAGLSPKSVTVVVGYRADLVEEEVKRFAAGESAPDVDVQGISFQCVVQEQQLGTGHAAQVAMAALDEASGSVLILPGDSPLVTTEALSPLLEDFVAQSAELAFLSAEVADPFGFGRIIRNADGTVAKIVEQKDCSEEEAKVTEINTSFYLATSAFMREALGSLENNNAQKEFYLTDIVDYAVRNDKPAFALVSASPDALLGANSIAELSALESIRRQEIVSAWMAAGVTFEDPQAAYIGEDVVIESDSFIGAGTRLKGSTKIGTGVRLDGDSLIENSAIGQGSHLRLGCYVQDASIAASCVIGPFAHIRPGSELRDGVKIGNFVETKKALLHDGVKVNHLSYVGDAEVGARSNLGAGTITCNYDGVNKHKTTIGKDCFVGSNSALVAPVTLGDEAYVGAGSTITKNVPGKSLGIARSRQNNIEGWSSKKK